MLRSWLEWARREFERGFLGRGRPRVGSRRRERLPRELLRAERAQRALAFPPDKEAEVHEGWIEKPPRPPRTHPAHSSYTLGFALVIIVLLLGLAFGVNWAQTSERGVLSVAVGVGGPAAVATPAPPVPPPAPTTTAAPTPMPSPTPRPYVVKPGDTLSGIARQSGTTVDALADANDLDAKALLQVGRELRIPAAPPPATPPPPTPPPGR